MNQNLALDIAINAAGIVLRCRPHVESVELSLCILGTASASVECRNAPSSGLKKRYRDSAGASTMRSWSDGNPTRLLSILAL